MTIPRIPRGTSAATTQARLRAAIIAVLAVLFVTPPIATRLADWLWYREVGFERVFLTMIGAQWALGLAAGLVGFVVLYLNARIALRGFYLLPRARQNRREPGCR